MSDERQVGGARKPERGEKAVFANNYHAIDNITN